MKITHITINERYVDGKNQSVVTGTFSSLEEAKEDCLEEEYIVEVGKVLKQEYVSKFNRTTLGNI